MKQSILFIFLISLLFGCTDKQPSDYVDPMIGTGFHGHTYPGATTPYGGVQLSPDTRKGNWDACSGYHYSDSTLFGFSHTHLSGTGCIDLGDLLFHPTIDPLHIQPKGYLFDSLRFSHKNEMATPGYYRVKLDNGILAELTATARSGVHRYTFPTSGEPKIVVDLAHLLNTETIEEAEISYKNGEITGMRRTNGWVSNQHIFFTIRFSEPFVTEVVSDGAIVPNPESVKGRNLQAIVKFPALKGKSVVAIVGISTSSVENARINLENEVRDFDFDRIKLSAQKQWNEALSGFQVSGGTENERINFYTALYHTMVTPNIISDFNGQYRGADQKLHAAGDRKVYSTFSIWDTFRAWNPLVALTDSAMVNNIVNSFLDFYDQTGELPIWPLSSGETGCMIGYHSVSVIYDAYSKNIRGYDVEKAFEAMKVSADKNNKGIGKFLDLGFIPADIKRESVACLLEGAYDDWCIAQMAKSLGHTDDYNTFSARAKLYQNVFDGNSKFFRGRQKDGKWESPFNPMEVGRAYTEATAWQYRFFVPHDINGLISLMGGKSYFTEALDSLFNTKQKTEGFLSDITGLVGQYAHGNEPSHHMAYLYNYVGQPWKAQQMVRRLLSEMYTPTPGGISGNEDCGQMSAWYVLSSIGLYSVCPGSQELVFTAPLFERTAIKLANGKNLEIAANNPGKNQYIQEVLFNGKPITENYITYSSLMEGGKLNFVLSDQPNEQRGTSSSANPYSMSDSLEVSIPYVSGDLSLFDTEALVSCGSATESAQIRYTLDGTVPGENSTLYEKPFPVKSSCLIKLKAFKMGFMQSATSTYKATKAVPRPAEKISLSKNGARFQYFEGQFWQTSDILKNGKEVKTGICDFPNISLAQIPDHFAFIFTGYLYAPLDGIYTFSTRSDDGSILRLGGENIVDNEGSHAEVRASGRIALGKGFHPYELLYFEDYEGEALSLCWILPGTSQESMIAPNYFYIK